jgi:general secretion pathway protein H
MLARAADPLLTGGADPATAAEQAAASQAEAVLKGPRVPKPTFRPVRQLGLEDDAAAAGAVAAASAAAAAAGTAPPGAATATAAAPAAPSSYGRALGSGIRLLEVHSAHQATPARTGRAYLYVWPGGQTERAYVQIARGSSPTDADTLTLVVHPLTGRVQMLPGAKTVPMPQTPEQASERSEAGGF